MNYYSTLLLYPVMSGTAINLLMKNSSMSVRRSLGPSLAGKILTRETLTLPLLMAPSRQLYGGKLISWNVPRQGWLTVSLAIWNVTSIICQSQFWALQFQYPRNRPLRPWWYQSIVRTIIDHDETLQSIICRGTTRDSSKNTKRTSQASALQTNFIMHFVIPPTMYFSCMINA